MKGKAVLVLEDGRTFTGTQFGAIGETLGEAVFSTGMSGYQETLTDPSYHRQIVVATAPQIGNTGWNGEDAESRGDKIWVAGYAVRDPSPRASNWRATGTLEDELIRLIVNTVKPESWDVNGGRGTIDYFPLGMALTVNQTPEIQEQVAKLLTALRRLQDETSGFTAFICWTFQPQHTALAHLPPAGAFEYLRTQAVARLYLDNIPNIQSSWVTQGLKVGQLALYFGANDMGSLMIEENVVASAGTVHYLTLEEIKEAIRAAGYIPRQRNVFYEYVDDAPVTYN